MQPSYRYRATIVNVVDGDTVDAVVDLGFHVQTCVRFRLLGINTEETNDRDPQRRALAAKAKQYVVDNCLNKQVMIQSHKTDKFGRWLGEIFVGDNTLSLNFHLLQEGLAVAYNGEARS